MTSFNKKKCATCRYHGTGLGKPVKTKKGWESVYCDYAWITGTSCGTSRGTDPENCLLYSEGPAIVKNLKPIVVGSKRFNKDEEKGE